MPYKVHHLFTIENLGVGVTYPFVWKNLPEGGASCVLHAIPIWPGSTSEGFNSTTEVEITRVWRRTRVIASTQGSLGGVDWVDIRYDILAHIKNIGGHVLNCDVYLITFTV